MLDCFVVHPLCFIQAGEQRQHSGVVGVQVLCLLSLTKGFIESTGLVVCRTKIVRKHNRGWSRLVSALRHSYSVVESSQGHEQIGIKIKSDLITWIEFKRAFVFLLGSGPIEIIKHRDSTNGRMGLRK